MFAPAPVIVTLSLKVTVMSIPGPAGPYVPEAAVDVTETIVGAVESITRFLVSVRLLPAGRTSAVVLPYWSVSVAPPSRLRPVTLRSALVSGEAIV